jgi:hypothetical protein
MTMKELLDEQLAKNKNAKYFVFSDKADLKIPAWRHKLDPQWVKRMVYLAARCLNPVKNRASRNTCTLTAN